MSSPKRNRVSRHGAVAAVCAVIAVAMVGAAFAAVPFYRAFCEATGFDGTPRRAATGPTGAAGDQSIGVRFDTNVRGLPWTLTPQENRQTVRVGRTQLVYFTITNNGDRALTGRATYNISPESAAQYFTKLQCFCFSDQTIPAHTSRTFPVVYYVDARFSADPDTRPLSELTLSYTMFPAPDAAPTEAKRAG
jgi:cytochrome c oxidase assembly protein subunit 11